MSFNNAAVIIRISSVTGEILSLVGGVAQWIERRSLTGELSMVEM